MPPPRQGACARAEAALAGPPPPGDGRVTQKAARRSEVKMAARSSGEAAVGGRGWSCGAAPVALVGAGLAGLALSSAGRRGGPRRGDGEPVGGVSPVPLTGAAPAARVPLVRSWRAGLLAVPPERRPLGLGLSGGSRASMLRFSGSSGAEGAREQRRSPWAAPEGTRGSLSCPDTDSSLSWFDVTRPKVRRNKA